MLSNLDSLEKQIDQICDCFEADWESDQPPEIADHLQANPLNDADEDVRHRLLARLVLTDLKFRLARGEDVTVEGYLNEFPELVGADGEVPPQLVAEATLLRRSAQPGTSPSRRPAMHLAGSTGGDSDESFETEIGRSSGDGQSDGVGPYDDDDTADPPDMPLSNVDDYELISKIAQGGMGVVYKARDKGLKCDVALKMIRSGEFAGREEVERFHREAEAAAKLQHPGIVRIHRIGETKGLHYFTMDFVQGQSLGQHADEKALPETEAVSFTIEVCEAVEHAHQHGILHRDIKPSNVLVDQSGRALVTDFGLAKRMEEESDFSRTGQALGTPGYMPPEQAEGRKDEINFQSDVYSIGALLYHLLTGHPPFRGQSHAEIIAKVLHSDAVAPKKINPDVSRDLNTICMKCLEKEPARRYMSAAALRDDLRRFSQGFPIQARPVTSVERTWRWCRRNRAVASLLLATFLAITSGVAIVVVQNSWNQQNLGVVEKKSIYEQLQAAAKALDLQIDRAEATAELAHDALVPRTISLDADQLSESLENYESLLQQWEESDGKEVTDEMLQKNAADASFRVAQASRLIRDFDRSEPNFLASIEWFERLQANFPNDPILLVKWGKALDYLGELYRDHDQPGDADGCYQASIEVLKSCHSQFPSCQEAHMELARTYNNYGLFHQQSCSDATAKDYYSEAESILRRLVKQYPADLKYHRDFGRTLINVGRLQRQNKKYDDASVSYRQALAEFDRLLSEEPENARYKFLSATTKKNLGYMLIEDRREPDAAERWLVEAREQFTELPTDKIPEYRFNLAKCLTNLVYVHGYRHSTADDGENQHLETAAQYCVKALTELSELHRAHPDVAEFDSWMGTVHGNIGAVADAKGEYGSFEMHMNEAIRHQEEASEKRPNSCVYPSLLMKHHRFFFRRVLQSYLSEETEARKEVALTHLVAAIELEFRDSFEDNTLYDSVRDDPRFQTAMKSIGYESR